VHDVRVALDLLEARDAHGAEAGDAADVVPAEVDEHPVLRELLLVPEEVPLESLVLAGIAPRLRVPAMGRTIAFRSWTLTMVSGEEPRRAVPSHSR
jgi:hypothetical protein